MSEVAVAYLIHDLEDGQNGDHPDRYLDMIGAVRAPDAEREGAGEPRMTTSLKSPRSARGADNLPT